MVTPLDALASGAAAILGRPLSEREAGLFVKYLKLLTKWNQHQRLVGSSDPRWIVENLFLDSLLFLRVLPPSAASLADVGSGAGLPGIPIKIVRPEIRVALIESRAKRASFLSTAVRELDLRPGIEVRAARVEECARETPHAFDAVVMRCAGDFSALARMASDLVAVGGLVIASGPPARTPLALGEWVEIPSWERGRRRLFAVYEARPHQDP